MALINIITPETAGLALAQEIRQVPTGYELPLVMLTSITGSTSRQRARKLSAVAFLNKPVKPAELYEIFVNQWRPSPRIEQTRPKLTMTQTDLAQKKTLTILLAEDNLINQRVAVGLLKKLGIVADIANNGLEAIAALKEFRYELVLMDLQMPDLGGMEATRRIRDPEEDVLDHDVPIIALTANAMESDREACLQAGMNDYLAKPIDLAALSDKLALWLPVQKPAPCAAQPGKEESFASDRH